MWALQQTAGDEKGAWPWLKFNNEPWEAHDSQYYGASLAAVALGAAPQDYRSTPEIQNNLKLLREYLTREYAKQVAINRVVLLWASTKWPGLLLPEQQASIIDEALSKQQADGGWSLSSLVGTWKLADGTAQEVVHEVVPAPPEAADEDDWNDWPYTWLRSLRDFSRQRFHSFHRECNLRMESGWNNG